MPEHVREILVQPVAPKREAESEERTHRIRSRFEEAAADAQALRGMLIGEEDATAWWRTPRDVAPGGREVTKDDPLTVLVAGGGLGGLAGLITAAACHAKGMKVALFEQASSYAPRMRLRAIERISPECFQELVAAGTVTADRVSGLKIGYKKGNKLAGLYDRGDWLVRFDTIGPALEAGLPATVVIDRPVIQQILVKHGFPDGTVRIKSRVESFEDLGDGRGALHHELDVLAQLRVRVVRTLGLARGALASLLRPARLLPGLLGLACRGSSRELLLGGILLLRRGALDVRALRRLHVLQVDLDGRVARLYHPDTRNTEQPACDTHCVLQLRAIGAIPGYTCAPCPWADVPADSECAL
ncbi:hypothetical protein EMIHUDRAFT_201674 [Emiliania huxleyi CCMP1516]|uniref:FAD-binding domain-containing protein n=2 Tax=Emiliania huxleyi TaxID=2903 RepID=A0A0D3KIE4_EMIH1|nr:hypothetical protein EMIHUDRAFT_201674 [Emiliania huxleyi CCMP1516]EOD35529.1 hypothetical protein EMIHUDRAFT_201674 [Emiliania huxleyi CCMP1516]|eukprot:XP_005787958.1 hypothetical protein EMIHUDRAFT_201674 [Emiliania huxleyi CCMP1516]